jgi:hypothetical protein
MQQYTTVQVAQQWSNIVPLAFSQQKRTVPLGRPVQSFEIQYLNTNYFNVRSLFGHRFGLRNHLGDIKVFDLIFDLIEI